MTAGMAFIDANIFIYYLSGIDEEKAERSLHLLRKLQRGEVEATTTDLVIAEVVWLLQRRTKFTQEQIQDSLLPLLQSPGLRLANKHIWTRVFEVFCRDRVELTDAHAVAVMEQSGMKQIYSFDTDFDRVESVERLEP